MFVNLRFLQCTIDIRATVFEHHKEDGTFLSTHLYCVLDAVLKFEI